MANRKTIYTIGYLNFQTVEDFIRALEAKGVKAVVDVRESPRSRKKGFSLRPLAEALGRSGILYWWSGHKLGGRTCTRAMWEAGCEELAVWLADEAPLCLMCCERDWTGCHRRHLAKIFVEMGWQSEEIN